jgi:peptidoglycan/LPS O-acetylase OafA/YrhL
MPNDIRPLTSIRFVFASLVVAFHGSPLLERAGLARDGAVSNFAYFGFIGVQFFFVLSGFILAYTYRDLDTRQSRHDFWLARFARIYPLYLLGLILVLPFQIAEHSASYLARTGALQLTLAQAWFPAAALSWNLPGWSLSVEAFFYLAFPLLLWRLRATSSRSLLPIAALVFVLSQVIAYQAQKWLEAREVLTSPEAAGFWFTHLFAYNPLLRLPEFVVGMISGLLFLRHEESLRRYSAWLVYGGIAGIALAAPFFGRIPFLMLHNGAMMPLAAVLILGLALDSRFLFGLPSKGFPVLLGKASYGMYILHLPIAAWMALASKTFFGSVPAEHPILYFAVYYLAVVILSIAVFRALEEPARKAIKRAFASRSLEQIRVPREDPRTVR